MERNYLCIPTFQLNLFTRDSSTIRAHLRKFTYLRRFVSGIDRKEPRLATPLRSSVDFVFEREN